MIKHESLSDRLNAYLNHEELPEISETQDKIDHKIDHKIDTPVSVNLITNISIFLINIIKIFVYGYALKIVFNTNWNFWQSICIGLGVYFILNFIYDLIHKNNNYNKN